MATWHLHQNLNQLYPALPDSKRQPGQASSNNNPMLGLQFALQAFTKLNSAVSPSYLRGFSVQQSGLAGAPHCSGSVRHVSIGFRPGEISLGDIVDEGDPCQVGVEQRGYSHPGIVSKQTFPERLSVGEIVESRATAGNSRSTPKNATF